MEEAQQMHNKLLGSTSRIRQEYGQKETPKPRYDHSKYLQKKVTPAATADKTSDTGVVLQTIPEDDPWQVDACSDPWNPSHK